MRSHCIRNFKKLVEILSSLFPPRIWSTSDPWRSFSRILEVWIHVDHLGPRKRIQADWLPSTKNKCAYDESDGDRIGSIFHCLEMARRISNIRKCIKRLIVSPEWQNVPRWIHPDLTSPQLMEGRWESFFFKSWTKRKRHLSFFLCWWCVCCPFLILSGWPHPGVPTGCNFNTAQTRTSNTLVLNTL